jgi:hypothetical protein
MMMNTLCIYLEVLGYLSEKMFTMRKLGRREVGPNVDEDAIRAYNNMHDGYRM